MLFKILNRKNLLLFASLLLYMQGFSQSIKGKVEASDGNALPFANVLLLNSKDSTLVKGAVSDTLGIYVIDHIQSGTYLISASMIGYEQAYLPPMNISGEGVTRVNTITLSDDVKQLKEVVVTEKRPFVEQYIDRMVINVANSIIASGSTALEVLEKAPGVTVDRQNGALQLRGKDGVIVQMDGKQTYLSMADLVTLLSTMSSDNIDQIELITNPSAKYDAAGNSGIINIRLKKNNNVGTNGSVSLGAGSGRYGRQRGSFQLNHRTKKVNLFANLSANHGGGYFDLRTDNVIDNGEQHNEAKQDTYIRFFNSGQNAKAGMDYFIGKNTTLGIVWTGFWSDNGEKGTASSDFRKTADDDVYLQASTNKTISSMSANNVANFNIQHTFSERGGQLSADFDIGRFSRQFTNSLITETTSTEDPSQPTRGLINDMPTIITITTAKIDYHRTVFAKWKMEAGLKSSYVNNDNDLTLSQGDIGDLKVDPTLSNHFLYTEQVEAAYTSFSGKFGEKTEAQFGVRAEHTHSVGNSITSNNVVTRDYLKFFPSVFLSQSLSKEHTLTFSYSYRIDRPNYQYLNPSRSYVDPYLYSRGNAYLIPQYTHSLELKHGFKDKLFTSIGAAFVTDLIFYIIQPVDSIRTERTPVNIGKSSSYNVTVSFPVTVMKGWNLQANFLGIYSRFEYTYQAAPIILEQISGRFNASNTFNLGHGWTGELTGWVSTPSINVLQHSPWLGSMDVGIQKSVNSKFQIKLSAQDVFHTNKYIGYINTPTFKSHGRLAFDTRVVMLSVTYSFGNQKLKAARQRRIGSADETERAN